MDEKTLIAFRMKFQSRPYQEIADATGFTLSTIETYFTANGNWKAQYDEWAEKEAAHLQGVLRQSFQGKLDLIAQAMVDALERANRVVKKRRKILEDLEGQPSSESAIEKAEQDLRGAENRVIEIGQSILDKIGLGAITRVRDENPATLGSSADDVIHRLTDAGVDPASIRFISPAPAKTEGSLPE